MMQGVLARGTARAIADLSPYVAGKTGTSDDENDAWFVGFTNDVTVAVWIGYDNADGKRRTLGGGATGGGVAVPIFEPVIQAVWADVAPRTALAPPSPEAKRQLACKSIDLESGEIRERRRRRRSPSASASTATARSIDTQYQLVSREEAYYGRDDGGYYDFGVRPIRIRSDTSAITTATTSSAATGTTMTTSGRAVSRANSRGRRAVLRSVPARDPRRCTRDPYGRAIPDTAAHRSRLSLGQSAILTERHHNAQPEACSPCLLGWRCLPASCRSARHQSAQEFRLEESPRPPGSPSTAQAEDDRRSSIGRAMS